MDEKIGLRGILEGVKDMLGYEPGASDVNLLKTRMECASSILTGVIKELTPPVLKRIPPPPADAPSLDPEADKAKDDLKA